MITIEEADNIIKVISKIENLRNKLSTETMRGSKGTYIIYKHRDIGFLNREEHLIFTYFDTDFNYCNSQYYTKISLSDPDSFEKAAKLFKGYIEKHEG